ncbi:unnamed protein product, partial [Effrenium voratum]
MDDWGQQWSREEAKDDAWYSKAQYKGDEASESKWGTKAWSEAKDWYEAESWQGKDAWPWKGDDSWPGKGHEDSWTAKGQDDAWFVKGKWGEQTPAGKMWGEQASHQSSLAPEANESGEANRVHWSGLEASRPDFSFLLVSRDPKAVGKPVPPALLQEREAQAKGGADDTERARGTRGRFPGGEDGGGEDGFMPDFRLQSCGGDKGKDSLQCLAIVVWGMALASEGQTLPAWAMREGDVGQAQLKMPKSRFRENHDHLLFVSYPCGFAKLSARQLENWPEKLPAGTRVQCFNIVHVLDSKRVQRLETRVRVLAEATEQVSNLLAKHEVENGYVSREVRRLKEVMRMKSFQDLNDLELNQQKAESEGASLHPLELLVAELHNNMRVAGSQKILVNGEDLFRYHAFEEAAPVLSPVQGVSLSRARE